MIKKIAVITTLLTSLAYGDMNQKGFFVGIDGSSLSSKINYEKTSTIPFYNEYSTDNTATSLSLKAGYQYYFTRIYARVNKDNDYKDNTRNKYEITSNIYELNVDYIPVLYTNKNKSWNIRGVFGIGVGANESKFKSYDKLLFSPINGDGTIDNSNKYYMEYGYQVGLMSEFDFGLSAELGYRVRTGLIVDVKDGSENATLDMKTSELYLGVNYLF